MERGSHLDKSVAGAEHGSPAHGVTPRVVFLSVALAFFFGYVSPIIDVKLQNTYLGAMHLPPGAVGALLLLVLVVNPGLRLLSQRLAFSRNEILTVYITCLFSCLVPGHGAESSFVPNLIAPFYYATLQNEWLNFLLPYLKPWFTPALHGGAAGLYPAAGQQAAAGWYNGLRAGESIPWAAWLVPLGAWSLLIVTLYTMLGCLAVMLRAQWGEREALAFPLLRLPMEMTATQEESSRAAMGSFYRNPVMWIGFGIAACLQLINGLSLYFPEYVPRIPLEMNLAPYLVDPPWNQVGRVDIHIYLMVVGVTYLLTSEISFSLWFFYLLAKLQLATSFYLGFAPAALPNAVGAASGTKLFMSLQQTGCYLAYVAFIFWSGREHFLHIMKRAVRLAKAKDTEKLEALSYPAAFWGFVLSFGLLVAWSHAAGIRGDIALLLWGLYLVIAVALARVVVECGLLFVQPGVSSLGALAHLAGSGPGQWLSAPAIVPGAFLQTSFMSDMRAFLLPSFVQGFKLAHDRKISQRPLLALIAVTIAITLGMSLWMNVRLGYESSGLTLNRWFANDGARQPAVLANQLIQGVGGSAWNWAWLGSGAAITAAIMTARTRFLWFPLHPLGYLMSLTYPMAQIWFSIFLGWLCKQLITRFGGTSTYRSLVPGFLGLVLGDVSMMLFWLGIDGWQHFTNHQLVPG